MSKEIDKKIERLEEAIQEVTQRNILEAGFIFAPYIPLQFIRITFTLVDEIRHRYGENLTNRGCKIVNKERFTKVNLLEKRNRQ